MIAEKEHLALLPEGAMRILVTADLELIKARFTERMHGNLPVPVAAMLERKHGCFDNKPRDYHIISDVTDPQEIILKLTEGET